MGGTDAATAVAVKILVEQHVIAEVCVRLQAWILREHRAIALIIS
jgi:hypothetical protein